MLQKIFSPSLILFVHHFHTNMLQIKQILVLDRNTEHSFYELMKSLFKNSIFFYLFWLSFNIKMYLQ